MKMNEYGQLLLIDLIGAGLTSPLSQQINTIKSGLYNTISCYPHHPLVAFI